MNFLTRRGFWLDVAEVLDAYRIFPRLFCLGYGAMVWKIVVWFIGLDAPTTEQTTFVTAITIMSGPILNWYMQTGRKWQ